MISEPESVVGLNDALSALVCGLQSRGERVAVLRNYEMLPDDNVGNDIDLLVTNFRASDVISDLHALRGVRVTAVVVRSYVTHFFVSGVHWGNRTGIQFDLITALGWKGIPYLTAVTACARALCVRPDIPWLLRVDDIDEALAMFVANVIVAGRMKPKYEARVIKTFGERSDVVTQRLRSFLGKRAASALVDNVVRGDMAATERSVRRWRRAIMIRALVSVRGATAREVISYYAHEVRLRIDGGRDFWVSMVEGEADQIYEMFRDVVKELEVGPPPSSKLAVVFHRYKPSRFSRVRVSLGITKVGRPDLVLPTGESSKAALIDAMSKRVVRRFGLGSFV